MPIRPSRPNVYTGSPLDRAGLLREDATAMSARLLSPESLIVPVWRSRSLVRDGASGPEAAMLSPGEADRVRAAEGPWAFLGMRGAQAVFAMDASGVEEPGPAVPEGTRWEDMRGLAGQLPGGDAAILAHARGLMHWRVRHGFCGNCGGRCQPRSAGNAMVCDACGAQHFPRTDPAVIMLVHRGEHALLGHSKRFPNSTMYSTLAGFVEPGESLEEAVAREVLEESGIRVGRVEYHSSQPWPFPASIMLGFHAEALSEAITVDERELLDVRWFSRAQMREPAAHGFSLPRADSIARRLIEDWMEQG